MRVHKCPECGATLDVYPEDAKFGYCYTCHESQKVEKEA